MNEYDLRVMAKTNAVRKTIVIDRPLADKLEAIAKKRKTDVLNDLSLSLLARVAFRFWIEAGAPMDGAAK
jgi:hypothetical protein